MPSGDCILPAGVQGGDDSTDDAEDPGTVQEFGRALPSCANSRRGALSKASGNREEVILLSDRESPLLVAWHRPKAKDGVVESSPSGVEEDVAAS